MIFSYVLYKENLRALWLMLHLNIDFTKGIMDHPTVAYELPRGI